MLDKEYRDFNKEERKKLDEIEMASWGWCSKCDHYTIPFQRVCEKCGSWTSGCHCPYIPEGNHKPKMMKGMRWFRLKRKLGLFWYYIKQLKNLK